MHLTSVTMLDQEGRWEGEGRGEEEGWEGKREAWKRGKGREGERGVLGLADESGGQEKSLCCRAQGMGSVKAFGPRQRVQSLPLRRACAGVMPCCHLL